jgi:hypothetical protein
MRNVRTRYQLALNMAIKDAKGDIDAAIRHISKMVPADAWLDGYINREVKIADIEKLCAETLRDFPDLEEDALIAEALRRVEMSFPAHPLN